MNVSFARSGRNGPKGELDRVLFELRPGRHQLQEWIDRSGALSVDAIHRTKPVLSTPLAPTGRIVFRRV